MGGELIFEGKKYISASRASKIIGYNSDYIGQLCRRNSLDCRMVGRSWFVSEESLKKHKAVAKTTPRGRIPIYAGKYEKGKTWTKSVDTPYSATPSKPAGIPAYEQVTPAGEPTLAFRSPIADPSPDFSSARARVSRRKFHGKIGLGVAAIILLTVIVSNFSAIRPVYRDPISFLTNISTLNEVEKKIDGTLAVANIPKLEVGGSLSYTADVFQSLGVSIGQKTDITLGGVYRGLAFIGNFLRDTSGKVRQLVRNPDWRLAFFGRPKERTGVAVLPSAKDEGINARVKEYVTQSFSDETKIVTDETGNSGLIKPVFKERNDQEYLYVIVPVKEDKKTAGGG